jgi:serine/threonine protein kinase
MNPQTQPQTQTETFQHYQVLRREDGSLWELGRGAMGVTYKAVDTNLRSLVALKVINTLYLDSDLARQRFLREAKAAASLRHRNVANVYHLGDDGQNFFYSMEYVDGETVQSLVDRLGPLPSAEALAITMQVARALGAACKQNLVHRDIKPANLMVVKEDDEDEASVVKVIDFGLARMSTGTGEQSAHLTMGGFVGTPQFASPEQLEEQSLDTRSDIYSLGITLWYMLAGRPPFTGSLFRISSQHLSKEPPWEQLEHVPQPVKALLAHMLQKDPANRPQTPTKLRLEIEACRRELEAAAPTEVAPPPVKAFEPALTSISDASVSTASVMSATEAGVSDVASPAPSVGSLLAGRYYLTRLVGEGSSGMVFQARDDWSGGRTVALKTFHPEIGLHTDEFYQLQTDLGRLQAQPHPHLLEVFSLQQIEGHKFSVSEWVRGFTVVDLLRARGRLTLREAMSLLAQASDAAAHAAAHRLHQLELDPHQILVNFSHDFGLETGGGEEALALVKLQHESLVQWPAFGIKIDALAPAREDAAQVTWAGDMTMAVNSPRLPQRDTQSSIRGLIEGSYLYSLAALTYELLSGAPPPDAGRNLAALPALSEEANQVLRRALLPNPGFTGEREFFEQLLLASGLGTNQLLFSPLGVHPATELALPLAEPETDGGSETDGSETLVHDDTATSLPVSLRAPTETRGGPTAPPPPVPVSHTSDTSVPPDAAKPLAPTIDPSPTRMPLVDSVQARAEQSVSPTKEHLVALPSRDSALVSLNLPEAAPVAAVSASAAVVEPPAPAIVPAEQPKPVATWVAPAPAPVLLPKFDVPARVETQAPAPRSGRSPVLMAAAALAALAVVGSVGFVALNKHKTEPVSGGVKTVVPVEQVPAKIETTPSPAPLKVAISTPAPAPEPTHAPVHAQTHPLTTPPVTAKGPPESSYPPNNVPEPTAALTDKPPVAEVRQTPAPRDTPKAVIQPVTAEVTPQPTTAEKVAAASSPKPVGANAKKNGRKTAEPTPDATAARIKMFLEAAKAGGAQAGVDTEDAAMKGAMMAAPKQAEKIKQMGNDKNKKP